MLDRRGRVSGVAWSRWDEKRDKAGATYLEDYIKGHVLEERSRASFMQYHLRLGLLLRISLSLKALARWGLDRRNLIASVKCRIKHLGIAGGFRALRGAKEE